MHVEHPIFRNQIFMKYQNLSLNLSKYSLKLLSELSQNLKQYNTNNTFKYYGSEHLALLSGGLRPRNDATSLSRLQPTNRRGDVNPYPR